MTAQGTHQDQGAGADCSLLTHWSPSATFGITIEYNYLQGNRQEADQARICLRLQAVPREDKGSQEKYMEVVDSMQRSGAGVDSDDSLDEDVPSFRRFVEDTQRHAKQGC